MKNTWLILILSTICACQSTTTNLHEITPEDQKVMRIINTMDTQILGTYGVRADKDFSNFNEKLFEEILTQGNSQVKKSMREVYSQLSSKQLISYKNTFVLCGYSKKHQLAFCDDAFCEGIEQSIKTSNENDLDNLKNNLKTPGVCKKDL